MTLSWANLAFASKREVNDLNAIFVMAPRHLSQARIKQLIKLYLPQGNLLFGISDEQYVLGFEDQPQFEMLKLADIMPIIEQVSAASAGRTITAFTYSQRDTKYSNLEKC
jgi:hypothetical protein